MLNEWRGEIRVTVPRRREKAKDRRWEGGRRSVSCETGHPHRSQASFGLYNEATSDKPLHLCSPAQWLCTGRENHLTHELPAVSWAQQAGLRGRRDVEGKGGVTVDPGLAQRASFTRPWQQTATAVAFLFPPYNPLSLPLSIVILDI